MSGHPAYTEFHPRWYRRQMSTWWWLGKRAYLVFILRELSSVFVAWFVVFGLLMLRAVGQGDGQYQRFLDWAASPWVVVVNVVALLFVLLHAITWFNLAPKAMVVRLRGQRVPGSLVAASQYAGWVVLSAFVIWLLVGAG
ncbi:MAG: fumarate reductase subunit C [Propionibacteriales bacterium]|nr:fumarate reductase subunit C [Propionibacteriales bacterium]